MSPGAASARSGLHPEADEQPIEVAAADVVIDVEGNGTMLESFFVLALGGLSLRRGAITHEAKTSSTGSASGGADLDAASAM